MCEAGAKVFQTLNIIVVIAVIIVVMKLLSFYLLLLPLLFSLVTHGCRSAKLVDSPAFVLRNQHGMD